MHTHMRTTRVRRTRTYHLELPIHYETVHVTRWAAWLRDLALFLSFDPPRSSVLVLRNDHLVDRLGNDGHLWVLRGLGRCPRTVRAVRRQHVRMDRGRGD
jgi:hypothetical protein